MSEIVRRGGGADRLEHYEHSKVGELNELELALSDRGKLDTKPWVRTYLSSEEAVNILLESNSNIKPDLSRHGYRFAKRVFDIAVSSVAIVALSVPMFVLCVAICVKSPGAGPFYAQYRVGRLGPDGQFRLFKMYKLRSMVPHADRMLEELQSKNEADGPLFKIKSDPRIIQGLGTWIRKHSIDELPQLINVFLGQMSLVGPRPPLPQEVVAYDERALQRLSVKPGCGGVWQTSVRSDGSFEEMVDLDLEYISESGILHDFSLVLKTIRVLITGKGAY